MFEQATNPTYSRESFRDYLYFSFLAYCSSDDLKDKKFLLPEGWEYVDSYVCHVLDPVTKACVDSSRAVGSTDDSIDSCKNLLAMGSYGVHFFKNSEGHGVVAFRGTKISRMADIRSDVLIASGRGAVLPKEFVAKIESFLKRAKKATLTGHSLGGYLAVKMLAAISGTLLNQKDCHAYNYDGPGVEVTLVPSLEPRSYRIRNIFISPNLVNAVNKHQGPKLQIANDELSESNPTGLSQAISYLSGEATDFIKTRVVFPLVAWGLVHAGCTGVNTESVRRIYNNVNEVASEFTMSDTGQTPAQMHDKLKETLRLHECMYFLSLLNEGSTSIRTVSAGSWPSVKDLLESEPARWAGTLEYDINDNQFATASSGSSVSSFFGGVYGMFLSGVDPQASGPDEQSVSSIPSFSEID